MALQDTIFDLVHAHKKGIDIILSPKESGQIVELIERLHQLEKELDTTNPQL